MKHTILLFALLGISICTQAQEQFQIFQEGFGKKNELQLLMNGGGENLSTDKDLIFELEADLTRPVVGAILLKNGKIGRFYIEPGATKVIVNKKGFPQSISVPGSKSHEIYQAVAHAKKKEDFTDAVLANIKDSIALKAFNVMFKFQNLNIEELTNIERQLDDANKRFTPDFNVFMSTLEIEKVTTGTSIYDFTGQDVNGKSYSTKDYRGKYLLIDFASTGCGPCWAGYPDMIAVTSEYDNLQVITYNEDFETETWQSFAADRGITLDWPVLWFGENKKEVFEIYNVEGWPLMFLVSPEGEVLDAWYGSRKGLLVKALKRHIE